MIKLNHINTHPERIEQIKFEIYKYENPIESLNKLLNKKRIEILELENEFKVNVTQNHKINELQHDILLPKYGTEKMVMLMFLHERKRIINVYNFN